MDKQRRLGFFSKCKSNTSIKSLSGKASEFRKNTKSDSSENAPVFTADETFMGGFEGDVSYHPSYPIANAISNFFYAGDNPRRFSSVKGLVISAADQRPEVPYKDRQTFMEFAARIRAFKGDSPPIPIYLVEAHQYTPIRAWKTNDEEWLPLPFNPKNLGMQHMLKDSITKLLPE